jgi:hypothetical protein
MMTKGMDNEDCIKLRELADQFNQVAKSANKAISQWMVAETSLDKAIIQHRIKDSLAWKKQVISLITQHPQYDCLHTEYMEGKKGQKIADNAMKAIENEMNAVKKTFSETPD